MKKQDFKVGERVRVVKCSAGDSEHEGRVGVLEGKYDNEVVFDDGDSCVAKEIERAAKDLDHLEVGDVLVKNTTERKVLAVLGDVIGVSFCDNHNGFYEWVTVYQLKDLGYTVNAATEPTETVMTIAEIEKKLGIEHLKVVKEDK